MIKVHQSGILTLGFFDINDGYLANIQGGEILVFDTAPISAGERRAPDVFSGSNRSALRLANRNDSGPFFFASTDRNSGTYSIPGFEAISGLSTGASFSQQYDSSSKVGIFGSAGFYAISSNMAEDGYITSLTAINTALYSSNVGKLTTIPSVNSAVVCYLIEFRARSVLNYNLNRPFYTAGSFDTSDSIIVYRP